MKKLKKGGILMKKIFATKLANSVLKVTPQATDMGGLSIRLGGKDKLPKLLKK
jgi:hypothetical protein